jgi:hypothetical protein
MAEIKSFPNNQDVYIGAEWVMKWLHGRTSGVFGAENNCAVSPVPDSLSVSVSDGIGWMSNNDGNGVVWWNDSEKDTGSKMILNLAGADGALNRIDRIVVSWQTTDYVDLPEISVLTGVPSSSPVPPALTNNASIRQISLARINVPAGTISISPSMITDERLDASVCGLVTEYVNIDTSMMQNQFESMLDAIREELTNIVGGTGFDLSPIRIEDSLLFPSMFSVFEPNDDEERKLFDAGYTYKAMFPVSGVLSNMFPFLTFSVVDVENSGASIANQFSTYDGGVNIYSDSVPNSNIIILTIEVRKAVS